MELDEAAAITQAFLLPYSYGRIKQADIFDAAGFCGGCNEPYCAEHWAGSWRGSGTCPRGHWQSLDPHWSPDD